MAPRGLPGFIPSADLADELSRSTEVKELLEDLADTIAERASELAPYRTGDLAESLEGDVRSEVSLGEDGFVGIVSSDDYKAPWWEFGTSRNEARPFLRPAVEEQGLDLEASDGDLEF